jgi:transposase
MVGEKPVYQVVLIARPKEKKMERLIIGVDVSQLSIDVAYFQQESAVFLGKFDNNDDGFALLEKEISVKQRQFDAQEVLLVLEPTGGYEQRLARFALSVDWFVSLPNPLRVREWARGIGIRAKTDRIDAKLLARYGASNNPPTWQPLAEEVEMLDDLLNRIEDIEKMLGQEKNRDHAFGNKPVSSEATSESLSQHIAFLEQQIESLKEAMKQHFHDYPLLNQQLKQLQSVPGVGQKNAPFLLVLLHRFSINTDAKGTSKEITAYVGLDPLPYQSGTSVYRRAGISRQGNKRVRHYLFMGALGGVRGNNPLKLFYQRLIDRGKAKMVALIAAARKILVWSWAIFQKDTTFDSSRFGENP